MNYDVNIKSITVNEDDIKLVFCYCTGSMQDKEVIVDLATNETAIQPVFVADQVLPEQELVFTRQIAIEMATQMGALADAEEMKTLSMSDLRKTYNHLLDQYLLSLYEPSGL